MKKIILCLIISLLTGFVSGAGKTKYKSTMDYILKTGYLLGIAEVKLNKDNSVTLVDAKSGYGAGLSMSLAKKIDSATIKIGESCVLRDGHHASITYELKKIEKGQLTFLITDKFDARSFGDSIKKETKTITIAPYKNKEKNGKQNLLPTRLS